jgi:hypothetical protein
MNFRIIGEITEIEVIAKGKSIKELKRLKKIFGKGSWRKLKGIARIKVDNNEFQAEIHWYEAHGIGKKEFKIKEIL